MKFFTLLMLIVSASLFVSCQQQDANNSYTLHLGVFLSVNSTEFSTIGFLPALDIAIETVNNHSEILKNLNGTSYYLNVIFNDSRCDASTSIRDFIDQIFFEPTKIMLIGSSCSVSTEPLAELSPFWNLVLVSPAATSYRLSSSSDFPRFLRTVPTDSEIVPGIAAAMRNYKWSRIALLTQAENVFTFFSAALREYFMLTNLQVTHEFQFNANANLEQVVESLRNSPARIVFINMYPHEAIKVMCLARQKGMVYPGYVFMFHNWYSDKWWTQTPSCGRNQIQSMLNRALLFGHYPRIPEDMKNVTNVGNLTFEEYESEYKIRLEEFQDMYPGFEPGTSDLFEDSVYVFDAVWTAALALHNASLAMTNQTLKDFDYNNEFISETIYNEALKTDFFGLSGQVNLNGSTDRGGFVRFLQYRRDPFSRDITKVVFAEEASRGSGFSYLDGENDNTVYPDGVPQDEEFSYIEEELFIVYTILSALGIVFACVALGFNLLFRNRPYVKQSSPYVNIMIIAGAVILYVTVILFGVDESIASDSTVNDLCHGRVWLCVIGFSLLYGTMFAKTWKIYHILKHSKLDPDMVKETSDLWLFVIVGILVGTDCLFMFFTTVFDSSRLERREKEINQDDDEGGLPMIVGVCDADTSTEWISVLFVYKGFVLLAGLYVAFQIRKVNRVSLNESRFLALSIYGAIIVTIALAPIGLLLEDFPDAQYSILGIMIFLTVTIILGLLFISKMYKLYKDPNGELIHMEEKISSDKKSSDNVDYSNDAYRGKVETLGVEIFQLRSEIQQLKHRSQNGLGDDETINSSNGTSL